MIVTFKALRLATFKATCQGLFFALKNNPCHAKNVCFFLLSSSE